MAPPRRRFHHCQMELKTNRLLHIDALYPNPKSFSPNDALNAPNLAFSEPKNSL
ncbi:hypothetical protein COLO4_05821 [Corchorus olitorius]|uniref:Uncharacterized protein n=1 Tax=Corchorus olitorius TaxID=93759 RepID=A0A1R3KPS8_9ROSI|nr:hypothetical protein COLO4_05821 [Corchorus olitorius]